MVNIIQRWLLEHKASAIWSILYRDGCLNIKASAIWSILYRDGCLNIRLLQYGQYYTEMVA